MFSALVILSGLSGNVESATNSDTKAFLQEFCLDCHGPNKQKSDRRFDLLNENFESIDDLVLWQEILDAINAGEMPPEEETQPSQFQTKKFVSKLTLKLEAAHDSIVSDEQVNYRRINRREYRNTIRDLCGINTESFDPTLDFPPDERWEGFENIASELVLSDYLLERYLEAASLVIDKAAQSFNTPESSLRVFLPNDMCDRKFHFRPQISFQVNVDGSFVDVGHGDRFSDRVTAKNFEGVPADGYYTIRVKAEGINREHPYDPKLLGIDITEPIKMEVLVADPSVGSRLSGNATDRSVAVIPLSDHQTKVYELRTWMDKGYIPVLRYINGPQPIKSVLFQIAPKYHPEVLPSNWRSGTDRKPAEEKEKYMSDVYQGPRMRIHSLEVEGPESMPTGDGSKFALFGLQAFKGQSLDADTVIKRFLQRAFRRPPSLSETNRYIRFFTSRYENGESVQPALLATFKAILCSPNFIYLKTPSDESHASDDQYRLASRLSYFLWSSMPDQALLDLASMGKLNDSNELVLQINRMLSDSKAKAFTENFTDSWLRLNDLGLMPPDEVKFPQYYERRLQVLMKEESRIFFSYLLSNNLSIEHFIDSDFTFINRYLADHYQIKGIEGDEFQKVKLNHQSMRGGLLGQASILTTTSNGVETSPVTRGIWILENILGTPPSPPPPNVSPLEPDIRGATSIREQLMKHRKVASCAECHRRIDPLGFALEEFDPIGSFRSSYLNGETKGGKPVDTSGKLSTGEKFQNLQEFKKLLLNKKVQFAHCLTEKMLTYALGRKLDFSDRKEIDEIAKDLSRRGYGLRDLVELIVTSATFRDSN